MPYNLKNICPQTKKVSVGWVGEIICNILKLDEVDFLTIQYLEIMLITLLMACSLFNSIFALKKDKVFMSTHCPFG